MLLGTFLLKHLAKASESSASRLSDDNFGILETTLNKRPKRFEVGLDEERATFDNDTESSDGRLSETGIGGGGEGANLLEEGREDLSGRKGSGEDVDDSESGTGGNIVVDIDGLGLGTDGKKGGDDSAGEVELLDLRLLELDDPEERVEGHDSEVVLVVGVGRSGHEELDEVGEVRREEGNFREGEGLEHLEDGFGRSLIGLLKGGRENADDRRNEVLESGLK